MDPLQRAGIAALGTVVIGLPLSWLARRVGWTDRIAWPVALLLPFGVAMIVYWGSRQP